MTNCEKIDERQKKNMNRIIFVIKEVPARCFSFVAQLDDDCGSFIFIYFSLNAIKNPKTNRKNEKKSMNEKPSIQQLKNLFLMIVNKSLSDGGSSM